MIAPTPQEARLLELAGAIGATTFRFNDEARLQAGLAQLLGRLGVPFEREVRLTPKDRIDFVLDGAIGLEVKVGGSWAKLATQLHRYAQLPALSSLLVVVRDGHLGQLPHTLNDKPVRVVRLTRSWL